MAISSATPMTSPNRWGAAPPARLLHRLPSLNRVVPQHPPPSHRLWWAGRNVAVGPDGDPLSVDRRRVGLEVTELLLLLGIQPPFTTSLFWRIVKAAVLVGHTRSTSQTGWHTEPLDLKRLLLLLFLFWVPAAHARCPKGFSAPEGYNYCVPTNLADRQTWQACGKEPARYGLNNSEPCMSLHSRIALADKFTEYCRKLKLPHLHQ